MINETNEFKINGYNHEDVNNDGKLQGCDKKEFLIINIAKKVFEFIKSIFSPVVSAVKSLKELHKLKCVKNNEESNNKNKIEIAEYKFINELTGELPYEYEYDFEGNIEEKMESALKGLNHD